MPRHVQTVTPWVMSIVNGRGTGLIQLPAATQSVCSTLFANILREYALGDYYVGDYFAICSNSETREITVLMDPRNERAQRGMRTADTFVYDPNQSSPHAPGYGQ